MQIAARTSGGVVRVVVGSNGQDYDAPPAVVFSGGGGAGATGVAAMAGTRVESVIITAGGTGYTSNPTVVLQAPTTAATVVSATTNATQSFLVFSPALSAVTHKRISQGGTTQPITFSSNTVGVVAVSNFSFSGAATLASGTGATATAYAHTTPLRPMSFFKGRRAEVYGVDGMGRGIRWSGGVTSGGAPSAEPLGLHRPTLGPVVTAASSADGKYVAAIQLVDAGGGYASNPTVSLSGGTPTRAAQARAVVVNGRVAAVQVTDRGAGYQATPAVSFAGGIGAGGTFGVTLSGLVSAVRVTNSGSGYTSSGTEAPTVTVSDAKGLSDFNAQVVVGSDGRIDSVQILAAGTGATTIPSLSITAASGSGAAIVPEMSFRVSGMTVSNSGSGYFTPPFITMRPDPADRFGGGAAADCTVSPDGTISTVSVVAGGQYSLLPTAFVDDSTARAQASLSAVLRGKYRCAIRYVDATPASADGPIPSSISETVEVDAKEGANSLTWSISHPYRDARADKLELWRTSGDQSALLFRVAILDKDATSYTDTLSDFDLTNPLRAEYGLMPITLPSGQINARRFGVPPGNLAVGVMFQDRAWYAVDTTGQSPNGVYYSEVDEPESVPDANELIVQENAGSPDAIVALVPLGSALLIVQSAHLYRLMYVAQPIIDASILLSAYRGVLNSRCWAVMAGVAFLADSIGLYAYDGSQEEAVSTPVDNYWRDGLIDFSKQDQFHVSADHLTRTVRFYYCRAEDTSPRRALCFCTATQAWWEETYPTAVSATAPVYVSGQRRNALGGGDGVWRKESGSADGSAAVPFQVRTGNLPLSNDPDRSVEVVYEPTLTATSLSLGMHYNNSPSARPSAVDVNRGDGFVATPGGNVALNMSKDRSALGTATGRAKAHYAGRRDDRSAGADQCVAIAMAGTGATTTGSDPVVLHALRIGGVG
jgi:hypothetical protein